MRLQPVRVISIAASALLPAVSIAACSGGGPPPGANSSISPRASSSAGSSAHLGTTAGRGTSGAASAQPASPAPAATTAFSGGTGSAATAQIKTDWQEFFSVKTPVATRISLLQNGSVFASILRSQASSPLAASAASTVSAVTVESPAQARVTYSILLHGTPALKNEPGVAVHQNGTWKVGDQSFCALLILESSKAPAACASAAG